MPDQARGGLLSPYLQRKRIQQALPFLEGSTLDYGCGNGALYGELTPAQRKQYLGYDPDSAVIATAQRRFPEARFTHSLEELRDLLFERVVSLAVIEHVPDVSEYLASLEALLDENGALVLTSPRPSLDAVHRLGARLGLFSSEASEEHNEYVTERSIAQYCSRLTLEIEVSRSFLFRANQLFVLRRTS